MKILDRKIFIFSVFALIFVACTPKQQVEEGVMLNLDKQNVTVDSKGNDVSIYITTNLKKVKYEVNYQGDQHSWLNITASSTQALINCPENKAKEAREAVVSFKGEGVTKPVKLKINQKGRGEYLFVEPDYVEVSASPNRADFKVESNTEYTYKVLNRSGKELVESEKNLTAERELDKKWKIKGSNEEIEQWLSVSQGEDQTDGARIFNLDFLQNLGDDPREVEIVITTKSGKYDKKIKVKQSPAAKYDPSVLNGKDPIKGDFKIKIASGKASSYHNESNIDKSFDGNYNTIYHSHYNNGGSSYFPITLEYTFANVDDVDYMIYHPRRQGYNGHFKEVEISYQKNTGEYVKLMDYDFKGSSNPTRVVFKTPLKAVKGFKFVVKSGHGDGNGFAACAEMEFYKFNPGDKVPLDIFEDKLATKLKSGVTREQIEKLPNELYKQIALYMYESKYSNEFRIAEFKAWPHPDKKSRENRNTQYSLLDNPTGISAKAGTSLIVLVGDTHGKNISLRGVSLLKPKGDGYWDGGTYPLATGINKIRIEKDCQLYINYHEEDYNNAPAIKVHFLTGDVQGYYDINKHPRTNEEFQKRLRAAVHNPMFDIVGEKAHLSFPVKEYGAHTQGRGYDLIKSYDEMVEKETELLGLKKYNRLNVNRAFFHVMYHSYMYSTSFRTAYNVGTCNTILNPDKFRSSIWGPAHELGHTHQVRPTLMWIGMTECTTNIMSLHIQTTWNGDMSSRIQSENIHARYVNRYDKAYYSAMVQKYPLAIVGNESQNTFEKDKDEKYPGKSGDVFSQLVNFWQLQLYFNKVLGQKDFYADLYEEARKAELKHDDAKEQLWHTVRASKISGYDLTEFFERWGYYRIIDKVVEDYAKRRMNVTAEKVDEAKNAIKELKLKQLEAPIWYICDANYKIFKDKKPIIQGGLAVASSNKVMVPVSNTDGQSAWENVVAFEVYNKESKLIGAANNGRPIALSENWSNGCKVYAINYKGEKTEVPVK